MERKDGLVLGTLVVWIPTANGLVLAADDRSIIRGVGYIDGHRKAFVWNGPPVTLFAAYGASEGHSLTDDYRKNPRIEWFAENPPTWSAANVVTEHLSRNAFRVNKDSLAKLGAVLKSHFAEHAGRNGIDLGQGLQFGVDVGQHVRGVSRLGNIHVLKEGQNLKVKVDVRPPFQVDGPVEYPFSGEVAFMEDAFFPRTDILTTLRPFAMTAPKVKDLELGRGVNFAREMIQDASRVSELFGRKHRGQAVPIGSNPTILVVCNDQLVETHLGVP